MFLSNKYCRWYFKIIEKARGRNSSSLNYCERHHILPRSLGGTDDLDNIVSLTAREHFVCHLLLTKFTQGKDKRKMCYALSSFHRKSKYHKRVFNSYEYEALRKNSVVLCLETISKRKFPTGKEHHMYGKNHTIFSKQKIRNSKFKTKWITPWGIFNFVSEATSYVKENKILGIKDDETLRRYCTDKNNFVIKGKRSIPQWRGKTPFELGFGVEK